MSIFYHDIFSLGTIPGAGTASPPTGTANPPAANRVASGLGNTWFSAMGYYAGQSNYRNNVNLALAFTGPVNSYAFIQTLYPGNGTVTAQTEAVAVGMYSILRLRYGVAAPFAINFGIGTTPGSTSGAAYAAIDNLNGTFGQNNGALQIKGYDTAGTNIIGEQTVGFWGTEFNLDYGTFNEIDVAFVVRSLLPGSSTVYNVEVWIKNTILGNVNTDDWILLDVLQCSWSGAVTPWITLVSNSFASTVISETDILEWIWGQTDVLHDPGVVSRTKGVVACLTGYPEPSYGVPQNAQSAGIVNTTAGLLLATTTGLYETTPDCVTNLYAPTDATLATWQQAEVNGSVQPLFAPTIAAGLTFTYSGSGTGTFTITTAADGSARYWTPYHNGTAGTPITLTTGQEFSWQSQTLAWLIANMPANWTAAGASGGSGLSAYSSAYGAAWLQEQATQQASGTSVSVQQQQWGAFLVQNGQTILALTERAYNTSWTSSSGEQNAWVVKKSTDGGATWGSETTIISNTPLGFYSGLWSTYQQKWFLFGYGGASNVYSSPDGTTWTAVSSAALGTEPYAAEFADSAATNGGTFFVAARDGYSWSSDGGVTWATLTAFDGGYSGGVQVRSYIPNDNAPKCAFSAYGYLWILAPDEEWGSSYVRTNMIFYRSVVKPTAALLTAGGVLFQSWKRASLCAIGSDASYARSCVVGTALAVSYGRDFNRMFYDANFFDADYPPAAAYTTGATDQLAADGTAANTGTSNGAYLLTSHSIVLAPVSGGDGSTITINGSASGSGGSGTPVLPQKSVAGPTAAGSTWTIPMLPTGPAGATTVASVASPTLIQNGTAVDCTAVLSSTSSPTPNLIITLGSGLFAATDVLQLRALVTFGDSTMAWANWGTAGSGGGGGGGAPVNCSTATGVFPPSVLANCPTGPTYNLTGVTAIGDLVPLPLVLQQYCSVNLTIPLAAAVAGDTVKFAVTSMADRTTILWEVTGTVNAGGLSVNVTGDDTYTQTPPPNGWYWFLVDTTTKLRIGEGPLTLEPGPLVS